MIQPNLAAPTSRRLRPLFSGGALLAGVVALGACAALPPATPARQAKVPAAYETASTFAGPSSDWPADRWWTKYRDSQLDGLIGEALAGSPTLAAARARVIRAQAFTASTAAASLPQINLNASVQEMKQTYNLGIPPQFVPQGFNGYGRGTLDFNWELDFWGKNRAAVAAATSDAFAAAADAAEARLVLSTGVASTYATLAQLFAERDITERAVKVREETAALVQQRVTNGLDTQAELKQAQGAVPATRARLEAVEEQIVQTRDALAALLGAGPDRGLAVGRPPLETIGGFGLPGELAVGLVGRRPDVVAARWRAEAATKRIAEAKAAFYPNINLAAYAGSQALHLDQLVASGSTIAAVGPALSLPIFQGGRLRANLRGAQADRDAAVAAYDEALTQALREVADAAAGERALASRLAESRDALAFYEGAYQVARLRYEGGLSTFQEVLLAEDAVLTERQIVSDLESLSFTLDVALIRALGGGYADPSPRSLATTIRP
jgi:NodT family efflux transporter outer membrane factor (OMF) lipoprotein